MQAQAADISLSPLVRERLRPLPEDRDYLCLGDLRSALGRVASDEPLIILDLGCGSSPYRTLFPNAEYRRTDLQGTPDIDYPIETPEAIPSNHFDLVLSTQVLEHVRDPEKYLRLALRSLKPGGKITLTTHGMFEEHACPEDYYRWTAQGLEHLLKRCEFEKVRSWKVTTQERASVYLMQRYFGLLGLKRRKLTGFCAAVANRLLRLCSPFLNRWLDRHAQECCVVDSKIPGHNLYIVLMVEGFKSEQNFTPLRQ